MENINQRDNKREISKTLITEDKAKTRKIGKVRAVAGNLQVLKKAG